MNEYSFSYLKDREKYGHSVHFSDSIVQCLTVPDISPDGMNQLREKNPRKFVADNIPLKSEHSVNTDRVKTLSYGMSHLEGGWPKEVNAGEYEQTSKFRKRFEKDQQFADAVKDLCSKAKVVLEQNNTIDLFEEFFSDVKGAPSFVENINVRTIAAFKDPASEAGPKVGRRTASYVCWSPETDKAQLASAYSLMKFQHPSAGQMKKTAFVWDVAAPNRPLAELSGPAPAVSLQYNHKQPDIIAAGLYSGQVAVFDVRTGQCSSSTVSKSHHDPVYSVCWLQSKTNSDFVSCSTDGRVLWWDSRNLSEPTHEKSINTDADGNAAWGGATCVEWTAEGGATKFLVGTESGVVVCLNKKNKGATEIPNNARFGIESGRHHGPVYALRRNPYLPKYFLSVGDWSAKVFQEDWKVPIINSVYHNAMLHTGCWSPTRPGVFSVGRKDGVVDFWDYTYRQTEPAFSHKVSDGGVWSMAIRQDGRLMACGDTEGRVTVLDLSTYLYEPYSNAMNERNVLQAIFDREFAREKNLDTLKKLSTKKRAEEATNANKLASSPVLPNDVIQQIENDFFAAIGRAPPAAATAQHNESPAAADEE